MKEVMGMMKLKVIPCIWMKSQPSFKRMKNWQVKWKTKERMMMMMKNWKMKKMERMIRMMKVAALTTLTTKVWKRKWMILNTILNDYN